MNFEDLRISRYQAAIERICDVCCRSYAIDDFENSMASWGGGSFSFRYRESCDRLCLSCWLGVGPVDFPDDHEKKFETDPKLVERASKARSAIQSLRIGPEWHGWPRHEGGETYQAQCAGELLKAYSYFTVKGYSLIVMPITQTFCDRAVHYPDGITYFPPGTANLDGFNVIPNDSASDDISIRSSEAGGASLENLEGHGLLVFPVHLDSGLIVNAGHQVHLQLIRRLSEEVDRICLNFVRYYSCSIDRPHAIPSRAGQLASDPSMSICLLFDPSEETSRIYGGAAFSVAFTGGIGVWLKQPEWPSFPGNGEVGKIVYQALGLYTAMLEASSETLRFIQALSLLEFLAFPSDYKSFQDVKKVIARYLADDQETYKRILDRFRDLTGKKDPDSGVEVGYRTRVIHIGDRIETLVPEPEMRRKLFAELDGYIRPVVDHMIVHSEIDFEAYVDIRKSFPAFLAELRAK